MKDKSIKPFRSSKLTWHKKPSGGGNQMAYLTKKVGKLKRKLNEATFKKLAKKHACDSLDSDSNSD
jgi:hypothetical protein